MTPAPCLPLSSLRRRPAPSQIAAALRAIDILPSLIHPFPTKANVEHRPKPPLIRFPATMLLELPSAKELHTQCRRYDQNIPREHHDSVNLETLDITLEHSCRRLLPADIDQYVYKMLEDISSKRHRLAICIMPPALLITINEQSPDSSEQPNPLTQDLNTFTRKHKINSISLYSLNTNRPPPRKHSHQQTLHNLTPAFDPPTPCFSRIHPHLHSRLLLLSSPIPLPPQPPTSLHPHPPLSLLSQARFLHPHIYSPLSSHPRPSPSPILTSFSHNPFPIPPIQSSSHTPNPSHLNFFYTQPPHPSINPSLSPQSLDLLFHPKPLFALAPPSLRNNLSQSRKLYHPSLSNPPRSLFLFQSAHTPPD